VSDLLGRIGREAGVPGIAEVLAERVSPADLRSLLLHVYRAHAARRQPAALMAQYERDATVAPAAADARTLHALDGLAFNAAEGFEALELAPVEPLGTNAVLGGIDQNNVLATVRNTEVLGDSTSSLALECACRRRAGAATVRLCAVHRVLRLQPFDMPGYTPHFRLFALVSAGRAQPDYGFEVTEVVEHLRVHLRLLEAFAKHGSDHSGVTVELSDARLPRPDGPKVHAHAAEPSELVERLPDDLTGAPARLLRALGKALPDAHFDLRRREGLNYYDGPMLRISVSDREGLRYPLIDGGTVPWTQRLLANRKERLLISGLGIGLIAARFL
jgi:hypothetical protein